MESDIRYYRRRAHEEMSAASRAVTDEARQRRLKLVDHYVQRLQELDEPSPFDQAVLSRNTGRSRTATDRRSAFGWKARATEAR